MYIYVSVGLMIVTGSDDNGLGVWVLSPTEAGTTEMSVEKKMFKPDAHATQITGD